VCAWCLIPLLELECDSALHKISCVTSCFSFMMIKFINVCIAMYMSVGCLVYCEVCFKVTCLVPVG
jgi:hypothetical protein